MPAPGFYSSLLRGYNDVTPEDFDLADPETEGILKKLGKGALGLLGTVGRGLDYPARLIRRGITGLEEPTGRDVLKSLGIDIGPNKEGFDIGDIASFGTEMAFDPLTWAGGFLGKTATGIAAKALPRAEQAARSAKLALKVAEESGDVAKAAKYAERSQRYAADVERLAGAPKLAEGWGAQAAAGQRQLADFGVPFTSWRKSIPATGPIGQAIAGGVGRFGEKVAETRPYKWLAEKFSPVSGLEKTAGMRAINEEMTKQAYVDAAERMASQEKVLGGVEKRLGVAPGGAIPELNKAIENPWAPTTPASMTPLSPQFVPEEPAIAGLGREITKQQPVQLKYEQLAGEPITELEGLYMHRPLSAAGRQYKSALEESKAVSPFASFQEYSTQYGAQMQRKEAMAGLSTSEANKVWYDSEVQRRTEELLLLNKTPAERKLAIDAIPKEIFVLPGSC